MFSKYCEIFKVRLDGEIMISLSEKFFLQFNPVATLFFQCKRRSIVRSSSSRGKASRIAFPAEFRLPFSSSFFGSHFRLIKVT